MKRTWGLGEMTEININLNSKYGTLVFNSVEDVGVFLDSVLEFWGWLNVPPAQGNISSVWNTITNNINEIRTYWTRARSNESQIDALVASLYKAFERNKIPLPNSDVAQFIENLRQESPLSAIAALAIWMNIQGVNWGNYDHVKGAMLIVAFDSNFAPETASAVRDSLSNLSNEYSTTIQKLKDEVHDHRVEWSQEREKSQTSVIESIRKSERISRKLRRKKIEQANSAIKRINDTNSLYREQMRIKAPVEYWKEKARTHLNNANSYKYGLLWFSVPASIVLLGVLSIIARLAISTATTEKPPAVYLVLVTIGIVATTIAFWAARIFTRLFLSEHHLAIDAEERAVMAETYLALTATDAATEADRAIVLSTLFRPTADGIVKDDGAPDLSPASLLSKFGAR